MAKGDDLAAVLVQNALAGWAQRQLAEQPWWKQKANTVTTAWSGLMTLVWWLLGTGWELPEWTVAVVGVVLFVGQVLGVNVTRNGFTSSTAGVVQRAAFDPAVLQSIAAQAIVDDDHAGEHRLR